MKLCLVIDKRYGQTYAVRQNDGVLRRCNLKSLLDLDTMERTSDIVEPQEFLPPLQPTAIFCIAGNYRKHVEETHMQHNPEPVMFMKNLAITFKQTLI